MKTALQLGAIAVGAVLGAWLRWGLALWLPARAGIPWGTLAANWIGAYAVGVAVAAFALQPQLAPEWRLFVVTGLLGALTTFSGFSLEAVLLLQRQQYAAASGLMALHLAGSLVLTVTGIATVNTLRGTP